MTEPSYLNWISSQDLGLHKKQKQKNKQTRIPREAELEFIPVTILLQCNYFKISNVHLHHVGLVLQSGTNFLVRNLILQVGIHNNVPKNGNHIRRNTAK